MEHCALEVQDADLAVMYVFAASILSVYGLMVLLLT